MQYSEGIDMETAQLEEKIYAALIGDTELMGLLPKGNRSIFHLQAPAEYPDYPILVYTPISDVPVLSADDAENLHRVTVRVHIITGDADYSKIYAAVKRLMAGLEFTRVQARPLIDGGKRMLVVDFKIVIGG